MPAPRAGASMRAMDAAHPSVLAYGEPTPAAPRSDDFIPVTLFEDAAGRLVVVDSRTARGLQALDGPLARVGRTRLALHHLAPAVTARLVAEGRAAVDGPDALNVLLAFATGLGARRADAY